jgi:hypothetical protein
MLHYDFCCLGARKDLTVCQHTVQYIHMIETQRRGITFTSSFNEIVTDLWEPKWWWGASEHIFKRRRSWIFPSSRILASCMYCKVCLYFYSIHVPIALNLFTLRPRLSWFRIWINLYFFICIQYKSSVSAFFTRVLQKTWEIFLPHSVEIARVPAKFSLFLLPKFCQGLNFYFCNVTLSDTKLWFIKFRLYMILTFQKELSFREPPPPLPPPPPHKWW